MSEKINKFIAKSLVKHPGLIGDFVKSGVVGLIAKVPISEAEKIAMGEE